MHTEFALESLQGAVTGTPEADGGPTSNSKSGHFPWFADRLPRRFNTAHKGVHKSPQTG